MNSEFKYTKENIELRRGKVLELSSQGYNQSEISKILGVTGGLISIDMQFIREQAKENIRTFIEKRLPEEVEKAFTSYDYNIKTAYNTASTTKDDKTKLQALDLVNKTISSKMEIINNTDLINYVLDLPTSKEKKEVNHDPELEEEQSFDEDGEEIEAEETIEEEIIDEDANNQ